MVGAFGSKAQGPGEEACRLKFAGSQPQARAGNEPTRRFWPPRTAARPPASPGLFPHWCKARRMRGNWAGPLRFLHVLISETLSGNSSNGPSPREGCPLPFWGSVSARPTLGKTGLSGRGVCPRLRTAWVGLTRKSDSTAGIPTQGEAAPGGPGGAPRQSPQTSDSRPRHCGRGRDPARPS